MRRYDFDDVRSQAAPSASGSDRGGDALQRDHQPQIRPLPDRVQPPTRDVDRGAREHRLTLPSGPQREPVRLIPVLGNGSTVGYAPSRDGQRFLVNTVVEDVPGTPIHVWVDWLAGVTKGTDD